MRIEEIPKKIAIDFVHKYHYSKVLPRLTKHYLGVFEEDTLVGVVTLGWGTQPLQTIRKVFPNHELTTSDYYEIGKMCFLPEKNGGNFGSLVIKHLVAWVKQNTSVNFIYTMADGIMGKCGYVYQAASFRYLGSFKTDVYMDNKTGEKIHPRSARTLLQENAEYIGKKKVFWLTHDFCEAKDISRLRGLMFRYIHPLNRYGRRILNSYPEYLSRAYPKDSDLVFERRVTVGKYEAIEQPQFNMDVFNHNYQKYSNNDVLNRFFS